MTIDLDLLLKAYASGIFPMADARDDPGSFWVEPKTRAVIPLSGFQMSRSLRKTIAQDRFRVSVDTAFERVIAICAEAADDRQETWINAEIEQAFVALHKRGIAHSVECWLAPEEGDDGAQRLVGGLYGLEMGGAFCGESMFSRATDASKVALAWLVARLKLGGFSLLDCQFMTDHLASLGAVEISQKEYLEQLEAACSVSAYSVSAMRSPIRSSGSPLGAGVGAGVGAGEGAGVGGAATGAVGVGADRAGAGALVDASEPAFGALDARLAMLESDDRGAVGLTASLGGFSSPGKLIAQLLTQTS